MQLTGVGHPFVDQHEARAILDEQLPEHVPRAGGFLIVLGDARVGLLAAQLIRQLAPQRPHHRAVGLGDRVAGRDLVAHQHDAPCGRQVLHPGFSQHGIHAGQFARGRA